MSYPGKRYKLTTDEEGYVDGEATRGEALERAMRRAERTGMVHRVFDTMAHQGRPELWEVQKGAPILVIRNRPLTVDTMRRRGML